MPDGNGNYDWRERMQRLEELRESVESLRDRDIRLHEDVQNLVNGIRSLIDRIPPESLR